MTSKEKVQRVQVWKVGAPREVCFQTYHALIENCSELVTRILHCLRSCSTLHYPMRLWIPCSSTKTSFELIEDINEEFRGFQNIVVKECLQIKILKSKTWSSTFHIHSILPDFTFFFGKISKNRIFINVSF